MEFVDGETLAARLTRGPLQVQEVVRYGIQIAEALDHAHRHGVVHRDLKPANIMLTKPGVKVRDFGLATLRAAAPVDLPLDRTPVASPRVTPDDTLGSVQYLAPERLDGHDSGALADLFAFGAVLFEMSTGRRAFDSGSPAGVIVFAPNTQSGLSQLPAAGGEPRPLTTPNAKARELSHRWPQFLPDGRHFIYFVLGSSP